jgi:CRP/FNR family transcriptional regulator
MPAIRTGPPANPATRTFWLAQAGLDGFADPRARALLAGLRPAVIARGAVLFRPGDDPKGFLLVLSGRVAVNLTGAGGRDIRLYTVEAGQTCIQTTLCMLGQQAYAGEAVALTDVSAVVVPPAGFEALMAESGGFRRFVFSALAGRLWEVTALLERVAFARLDERLADALLAESQGTGRLKVTHEALARRIGSAREAVSRKLETWAARGLVALDRGSIQILDRRGLAAAGDGIPAKSVTKSRKPGRLKPT